MTARPPRRRLDQVLVDRGLVESRNVARGMILAGDVMEADSPVPVLAGADAGSKRRLFGRKA